MSNALDALYRSTTGNSSKIIHLYSSIAKHFYYMFSDIEAEGFIEKKI